MIITKIGDYYLKQYLKNTANLTELSNTEYTLYEQAGIKRILQDEHFFKAPEVDLTNLPGFILLQGSYISESDSKLLWEKWVPLLASTNGLIYKISIQHMTSNKRISEELFKMVLGCLKQELMLGKPSEHLIFSKIYIWDDPEGNVVLDQRSMFGNYSINLTLTSSLIKNQV